MFKITKGITSKLPSSLRLYHSFYHANPAIIDSNAIENKIFEGAMKYVPSMGFSKRALEQASIDMGVLANVGALASNGADPVHELVLYHLKKSRMGLIPLRENLAGLGTESARIKYLVKQRLMMNEPIVNQLPKAISYLTFPGNVTKSMEELHNLSDDISFYCGDRSNDFAWYSKRMAISGVYVQSELFMSQDKSNGFQNTLKFVDDRLNEVETAGWVYNCVEEWAIFNAWSALNGFKSIVMRG